MTSGGRPWYGNTTSGAFVCQSEGDRAGIVCPSFVAYWDGVHSPITLVNRGSSMRSLCVASVVSLWALLSSSSTLAQACPALMRTASRLIVVTVPTLTSPVGTLRLFERRRSDAGWSVIGTAQPVTLGSRGVAWGR